MVLRTISIETFEQEIERWLEEFSPLWLRPEAMVAVENNAIVPITNLRVRDHLVKILGMLERSLGSPSREDLNYTPEGAMLHRLGGLLHSQQLEFSHVRDSINQW
jgi:hypothetical protein